MIIILYVEMMVVLLKKINNEIGILYKLKFGILFFFYFFDK